MTDETGFMQSLMPLVGLVSVALALGAAGHASAAGEAEPNATDPRNIRTGRVIPDEGYCDQPYVVITDDGNWLCTMTTGEGREGHRKQHIVATISRDRGKTWSKPVDIEPPGPPEASWVMPVKVPGGRVYAIYTYNVDDLASWQGKRIRADTIGQIVCKYSDDHGRTWSKQRYVIPSRVMAIDRNNFFGGKVLIVWCVGKPVVVGKTVYWGGSKVGHPSVGPGPTEGIFWRSDNLLTERDPAKVRWEMLPVGDVGLKAPRGHIAEEHNLTNLSDGTLYCTYRTVDGFLCAAYSHDGGRTWHDRQYARYAPGGRYIKNPRGPSFVRRYGNGKYTLVFYNHGGTDFTGRNPYWICGGVEKDGSIHWSQPEIALYDDDPKTRMGYPDFIEDGGRYYMTETNKSVARVHELDRVMLEGMWHQVDGQAPPEVARRGLVLSLKAAALERRRFQMPRLPDLAKGGGFAIGMWIRLTDVAAGQVVLDARDDRGKGVALTTQERGALSIELSDGTTTDRWTCDPHLLQAGKRHHVAVIVDGGPKVISFVVDGVLCDGGTARRQGWHRFKPGLGDVNGRRTATIGSSFKGELERLRIYDRFLRTAEAVGNFRTR